MTDNFWIYVEVQHEYVKTGSFNFERTGVQRYKHITLYTVKIQDKANKKFTANFGMIRPRNKQEAFKLHKIFRDLKEALLHSRSNNPVLQQAAMMKINLFPNIKVQIIHKYKNAIPKRHLIKNKVRSV